LSEHEDIGIISNDELQTSLSEMLQSFINNAVDISFAEVPQNDVTQNEGSHE
jgi:hypothetical protein